MLARVLARPWPFVAATVVALAGSLLLGSTLGAEFVPRLDEGELSLDVRRLPSISITEAQRLGVQVEASLARFPEARSIVTRTGRAEVATDPVGPDETEAMVKLRPKEEWTTAGDLDALGEAIKRQVEADVPATFVSVSQPIEDRVNQLLAGSRGDLVIKVFGADLTTLKQTADRIGARRADIPGCGDWRVQRVLGLPLLEVTPDRQRLARYGLSADRVMEVVEASRVGRPAGTIFEGPRRFDLTLLLPPGALTPEGFGDLLVGSSAGQLVPLASVATVRETEGPAVINREALQRRVLVEVNVRGRDLVSFVNEARARVAAQVRLPEGVTLAWGGQFENFTRASQRLGFVAPAALGVICAMLFLMFGDLRIAAAVFVNVPLALMGGLLALWLRGLPFSIPAAVGFIAVAGVAVLNGVVHGGRAGPAAGSSDSPTEIEVRRSGAAVFRPVLTTALVAAFGFIPMAISTHAGAEVQRPLATVVIGGIVSSTLLGLFMLPHRAEAAGAHAGFRRQPGASKLGRVAYCRGGPRRRESAHTRKETPMQFSPRARLSSAFLIGAFLSACGSSGGGPASGTGGSASGTGGQATGGTTATGGSTATGGATGTGGVKASGGSTGTGGVSATGGATGTGGAAGRAGTGGRGDGRDRPGGGGPAPPGRAAAPAAARAPAARRAAAAETPPAPRRS